MIYCQGTTRAWFPEYWPGVSSGYRRGIGKPLGGPGEGFAATVGWFGKELPFLKMRRAVRVRKFLWQGERHVAGYLRRARLEKNECALMTKSKQRLRPNELSLRIRPSRKFPFKALVPSFSVRIGVFVFRRDGQGVEVGRNRLRMCSNLPS